MIRPAKKQSSRLPVWSNEEFITLCLFCVRDGKVSALAIMERTGCAKSTISRAIWRLRAVGMEGDLPPISWAGITKKLRKPGEQKRAKNFADELFQRVWTLARAEQKQGRVLTFETICRELEYTDLRYIRSRISELELAGYVLPLIISQAEIVRETTVTLEQIARRSAEIKQTRMESEKLSFVPKSSQPPWRWKPWNTDQDRIDYPAKEASEFLRRDWERRRRRRKRAAELQGSK